MNRKYTAWKWLFCVGILAMLTAPCLQAADQTQTTPLEALPLDNVRRYIRTVQTDQTNTSLQNSRTAKELIGKLYSGLVLVGDVEEGSKVIKITEASPARLAFWVEDAKLKEKAAQLRKGDTILITARLKTIGQSVETLFTDVQSLDVQPKDQIEQKK